MKAAFSSWRQPTTRSPSAWAPASTSIIGPATTPKTVSIPAARSCRAAMRPPSIPRPRSAMPSLPRAASAGIIPAIGPVVQTGRRRRPEVRLQAALTCAAPARRRAVRLPTRRVGSRAKNATVSSSAAGKVAPVTFVNPWALPSVFAAAISLGLLGYLRAHRPPPPLWPSLPASLLGGVAFAVGDVLSSFGPPGPLADDVGLLLLYSGALLLGSSAWVLVLRVAEVQGAPFSWGRSPWARAPLVFAAVMWLVVLTNPWHRQFVTPQVGPRSQYHWLWYVNTVGLHGMIAASALLFARLALRARARAARSQDRLMVGALFVPALCNLAYILPKTPPPFDPTSIGLCVTGAVFVFGIYRRRLFALEPIDFAELLRQQWDGVLLVGRAGHLLYRNPASDRWIGPQSGAAGDPALPLLAGRLVPAAVAGAAALDAAALETELLSDPQPREGRLYRVPDEDAWVRVECRPLRNARGRLLCWMLRLHDETALRRSEEAVQHAQKLESLGVLAGGIAHDFNNLLLAMLGNAGLAREVVELDASRLARDVVELVAVSISKQVGLRCRLAEDLPAVKGDASRLRQVVMNLVLNAADAIGDREGAIAVESELVALGEGDRAGWVGQEAWRGGRFVALRVSDTGAGM